MRKFLTGLVLIPLGVIFIVFAFANRHLVTVTFDPFDREQTRRPASRCRYSSSSFRLRFSASWPGASRPGSGSAAGGMRRASLRRMRRQARLELADLRSRWELPRDMPRLPDLTRRAG